MNGNSTFIFFVFFVIGVFLLNNHSISGKTIDVSHRFCVDSDNGLKPYMAGYVKSDIGTFNDRCEDNLQRIREYHCGKGIDGRNYRVISNMVNCGEGYICSRDVVDNADACVES